MEQMHDFLKKMHRSENLPYFLWKKEEKLMDGLFIL